MNELHTQTLEIDHASFDPTHAQLNGHLKNGEWQVGKFLFVDFDGVLHHDRLGPTFKELVAYKRGILTPETFTDLMEVLAPPGHRLLAHADCLAEFSEYINAGVVISTSWRVVLDVDDFYKLLGPRLSARVVGVMANGHEIEMRHQVSNIRGLLAHKWMLEANACYMPWVAFDDHAVLYGGSLKYLVQPDPAVGLQEADYDAAREKLEDQAAGFKALLSQRVARGMARAVPVEVLV